MVKVKHAEQGLNAQKQELMATRTTSDELRKKLNAREQELKVAQATIEKFLKSSSWRITAPLRRLTRRFGKLRPSIISRKFRSALTRSRRDEGV